MCHPVLGDVEFRIFFRWLAPSGHAVPLVVEELVVEELVVEELVVEVVEVGQHHLPVLPHLLPVLPVHLLLHLLPVPQHLTALPVVSSKGYK